MTAARKILGTALAICTVGIAATLGSTAFAQGLTGVPLPGTSNAPANAKPTIAGNPSRMLVAGSFYDFRPSASDPDSAQLTFTISKKPRWANFDASSGRLYGTPSAVDVGKIKGVQVSVSDGVNRKALAKFSIKVIPGVAPTISGTPATTATEGEPYQFQPSASDGDQQKLQFAIVNKPSWASFDAVTGRLAGTPPAGSAGTYGGITISVTDGATTVSLTPFTITVAKGSNVPAANSPPSIGGTPPMNVQVGQVYDFTPTASDKDGDTLTFASVNIPTWLTFDRATGRLNGKPQSGQEATYSGLVISVSDGNSISFLGPFSVTVVPAATNKSPVPNAAPLVSGTPPTSVSEGKLYSFQPTASDANGDPLVFSVAGAPQWLAISPATGLLSGTAPTGSAGTYSGIVISVTDGTSTASLPAFTLTVTAVQSTNSPPLIGGTPPTSITVGQSFSFTPTASDPDGDKLTFSWINKPSWMFFDAPTGRLTGTPTSAHVGTFSNIRILASDGKVTVSLTFTLTVTADGSPTTNRAPTISGAPAARATVGQAYVFQPVASDPDGQILRFGIANAPSWANFDVATGRLSGTPGAAQAGSTASNIVISVSDGIASATLPAFSISVESIAVANRAPTISGTPATSVTVGQAYVFQPVASDPDGQELRFGIANKPDWANFDIVTGRLSGTPADADVGPTANVVISVSDGALSATLPAFTLTVLKPVIGSAELTWTAPTQNEDGSALTNLAGYKVFYGNSPGALTKVLDVVGAGVTSAVIEGLAAGTWYFSISSYTNTGVESAPTGTVYKTIQ
jgi:hypothetical protein